MNMYVYRTLNASVQKINTEKTYWQKAVFMLRPVDQEDFVLSVELCTFADGLWLVHWCL